MLYSLKITDGFQKHFKIALKITETLLQFPIKASNITGFKSGMKGKKKNHAVNKMYV